MERAKHKLQALLALWHEKRGARSMPLRTDLPVSELRPWLGNLALIDLTGSSPYFRLCGTNLHSRFSGEMTKHRLENVSECLGGKELRLCIAKIQQNGAPIQTTFERRGDDRKTIFHELCLPLGRDGEQPDTVLFASYSEQIK